MPMGIIGAGLNARHLQDLLNLSFDFSVVILVFGWLSFLVVMSHYVWHLLSQQNRSALIEEWYDPFRRSFLPGITLTSILFILSITQVFELDKGPNQLEVLLALLFMATIHLVLNVFLINGWLFDEKLTLNQHKPTWYILLSGNFVVVIALNSEFIVTQNSFLYEVSMFFYAVGLFFWLVFTTTLFYRLMFNNQLQTHLRPSLFIFLAPSSLACVASIMLSDTFIQSGVVSEQSIGLITWFSFSFATIMLIAWLLSFRFFYKSGLTMAGWSFVYPLAAYGLAAQFMAEAFLNAFLLGLSIMVFIMLLIFILLLTSWLIKLSFQKLVS